VSNPAEIRWTVRADQIDPDRWAQAIINALQGGKEPDAKRATRWGTWPAAVLILILFVALAALTGNWLLLVGFVPLAVVVGGLFVLNRQTVGRTAKQIRSTPSALEPFTFTADASGTRSESASGSDKLDWVRYRDVMLDEDLIVLTLDNKAIRVLPVAALSSGQSATQAVEILKTWIVATRSRIQ
jgi:hypothetical protein